MSPQPTLHILEWASHQGWEGALCLTLIYALACITFLPGSLLTLGAGVIYGYGEGVALISLGSLLGSTASFLMGRHLLRRLVEKKLSQHPKFLLIDRAIAAQGWKIVLLSRLSPLFPFSLLNYGLGLTQISLRHFLLASWLGTLPLISAYVYIGMLLGNLAHLDQAHANSPILWILRVTGLIATLTLAIYTTRIANKALQGFTSPSPKR